MSTPPLVAAWNRFWFEPQSPAPICLYRILFALLLLQSETVIYTRDFDLYYGARAMWPIEGIAQVHWLLRPQLDLLLLFPGGDAGRYAFLGCMIVLTILMLVGFCTRISMIVLYLFLLSLHNHCPVSLNSGELFQRLALFLLCFSRCGDMYSIDALLKRRAGAYAPVLVAPWAQRLLQLQLTIAYCHTACCKLLGPHWIDGTAIYYATRFEEYFRAGFPPIYDNPFLCKFLTYSTLVIEFALWTLIWWKPVRMYVLLVGVCFHLGIMYYFNLPIFEETFIIPYVLFLDPNQLERFVNRFVNTFNPGNGTAGNNSAQPS